jgi:hypothetical protein
MTAGTTIDVHALRATAARCREAAGDDRALDVALWLALGWTEGGDVDLAWRHQLPLAPDLVVNGMAMADAMARFPSDMAGIARSWNVPRLTRREDAAASLMGPIEHPLVWTIQTDFGGLRRVRATDGVDVFVQADAATPALATCAAAAEACAALIELGRPLPDGRSHDPRY